MIAVLRDDSAVPAFESHLRPIAAPHRQRKSVFGQQWRGIDDDPTLSSSIVIRAVNSLYRAFQIKVSIIGRVATTSLHPLVEQSIKALFNYFLHIWFLWYRRPRRCPHDVDRFYIPLRKEGFLSSFVEKHQSMKPTSGESVQCLYDRSLQEDFYVEANSYL